MKDNSFERAMNQIVGEAQAEQQREARNAKRQEMMQRVRTSLKFVVLGAVLGTAFFYRSELQAFVSSKLEHKPSMGGVLGNGGSGDTNQAPVSSTLSKASENAAIRDQIVDETSK